MKGPYAGYVEFSDVPVELHKIFAGSISYTSQIVVAW